MNFAEEIGRGTEFALPAVRARVTQNFANLELFALHLVTVAALWKQERKHALNAAAGLIKKDARAQIGHYQDAVGQYPEWAPLAESTEDQKARMGYEPDAPLLAEGDLKKSFRSTLEGEDTVIVGSTDPVMEFHEFGTVKMPPRPVLGPALLKNIENIQKLLGFAAMETVVSGQRMGYRFSLKEWGEKLEEDSP